MSGFCTQRRCSSEDLADAAQIVLIHGWLVLRHVNDNWWDLVSTCQVIDRTQKASLKAVLAAYEKQVIDFELLNRFQV